MKLIALVLLLSSFSSLTLTEVVNSFENSCPQFFLPNPNNRNEVITPTVFNGLEYKRICQLWENKYRFATLYDTKKRIPVFSAYTILQNETFKTDGVYWKIEPQLEDDKRYETMKSMIDCPANEREINKIFNQAVTSDYPENFTRGHVFPKSFAADRDQSESTFTLTNIAPQKQVSNNMWGKKVEEQMLKEINRTCKLKEGHKAYIVTGVVPGNGWISLTRRRERKGINIPTHFWSAFCCTNGANKRVMRAYIAKMEPFEVENPTIDDLNKKLTELYGPYKHFKVFGRLTK